MHRAKEDFEIKRESKNAVQMDKKNIGRCKNIEIEKIESQRTDSYLEQ